MKTTINLILTGQFTALLQQLFGGLNGAAPKYSFQPLPSYWAMTPASRVAGEHINKRLNN